MTSPPNTPQAAAPEPAVAVASPFSAVMPSENRPEIVVGLVGPIGTDLDPLVNALTDGFIGAGYQVVPIRLSDSIQEVFGLDVANLPDHERIEMLMAGGTMLREKSGQGDAIAWLGVEQIAWHRRHTCSGRETANAFILRSLKHPAEIERLRAIYGRGFIVVSAYSPREERVSTLAQRFTRAQLGVETLARAHAERLIEKDETEAGKKLGQDVKDAFPLADFFVDVRDVDSLKFEVRRFLELFFGYRFHTPTRDEHGMYHARSAALRSADLNRQVGAAILSASGDLLSLGCNDVPKAGGDLYWAGDEQDARDFKRGFDSSARQRDLMLVETLGRLKSAGLLVANKSTYNVEELVRELVVGDLTGVLKGAAIMSLLEFGRSVHAEMAAISSAARLGIPIKEATLFTTTFPCHMCARHIVAAGIKRVVYIEPYPKSRARQLHNDSIAVDPSRPTKSLVNFEPFQGISPRNYQVLFDAADLRKNGDGTAAAWRLSDAKVRFQRYLNSYQKIELTLTTTVVKALRELGKKHKEELMNTTKEQTS